jgi:WD40 repeat protein
MLKEVQQLDSHGVSGPAAAPAASASSSGLETKQSRPSSATAPESETGGQRINYAKNVRRAHPLSAAPWVSCAAHIHRAQPPPKVRVDDIIETNANTKKWHSVASLRSHLDAVRSLAFFSAEPVVVSASEDGTLKLWQVSSAVETSTVSPPPTSKVALHPPPRACVAC